MATKTDPDNVDCYAKALGDEPMFVLLARDPGAPAVVREWAYGRLFEIARGDRSEDDRDHVQHALGVADEMQKWRAENDGKWRVPS